MTTCADVTIYGDSIMRATVFDGRSYHSQMKEFLGRLDAQFGITAKNRSRFGCTIDKGAAMVENDISEGEVGRWALLEYGGNDCNFDWTAVSQNPDCEHYPATSPSQFKASLERMVACLSRAGSTPLLMTLPPIDAQRYFDHIVRMGNDAGRLMHWLRDVQVIYRFQELYSNAVAEVARRCGVALVDVRSRFLDRHGRYEDLISPDGLHPTAEGYELIYSAFEDFLNERRSARAS